MKKLLIAVLFAPLVALAQTFPSPTFSSLTLQNPLTVANGGTGVTTSTGSGSVVLSTSPTITGGTIAGGSFSGGTINNAPIGGVTPSTGAFTSVSATGLLTLSPTSGTNAFAVTQTAPASYSGAGPLQLNSMAITAPVNDTGTDSRVMGLYSDMEVGGAASKSAGGFYNGFFFVGVKTASPNIVGNVAALVGGAYANASTGTGSGLFGANPYAICASGCVFSDLIGVESDVELDSGGTTTRRVAFRAVNQGATALASGEDAAFVIDSTNSGGNFLHALDFANEYGGGFPIQPTGDIIHSEVSGTVANIINLPNVTVTGSILNFPNSVLSGAGGLSLNQGIVGRTNGSVAPAGFVGENPSNSSNNVSMSNLIPTNCASVSLTAGDWEIWGTVQFNPAGTTTISALFADLSTTSATFDTTVGNSQQLVATFSTGAAQVLATPHVLKNFTTTTTAYLIGESNFGASTMTCSGSIQARRID